MTNIQQCEKLYNNYISGQDGGLNLSDCLGKFLGQYKSLDELPQEILQLIENLEPNISSWAINPKEGANKFEKKKYSAMADSLGEAFQLKNNLALKNSCEYNIYPILDWLE